jgi:hypothetical protein
MVPMVPMVAYGAQVDSSADRRSAPGPTVPAMVPAMVPAYGHDLRCAALRCTAAQPTLPTTDAAYGDGPTLPMVTALHSTHGDVP